MKTLLAALALTAVSLTGCTPATTPEVEIIDAITITAPASEVEVGEAATLEAETGLIPAIAQDAGSPVETVR